MKLQVRTNDADTSRRSVAKRTLALMLVAASVAGGAAVMQADHGGQPRAAYAACDGNIMPPDLDCLGGGGRPTPTPTP